MGSDKRHRSRVASVEAQCGSCRQPAELTLYESRRQRRALDVFRRGLDDRVDRWIKCSACRRAYPAGATTLFDDPDRWVDPGQELAEGQEAWAADLDRADAAETDEHVERRQPAEDGEDVEAGALHDAVEHDEPGDREAPTEDVSPSEDVEPVNRDEPDEPVDSDEPDEPAPTVRSGRRRRRATRPQQSAGDSASDRAPH